MSEYHYYYCATVNRGHGSLVISGGIYKTKTPIKFGETWDEFVKSVKDNVACNDVAITSLSLIYADHA